ncbi:hypothetical protein [Xanthocytophaga agilis]|uniref:Uncharacterized protein n=1 Tax=Xanthocytophaga agilis TaxID=3048010 RepID=A0AAE3R2T2_9BACT|nr:hypothetical protein [Xanthocytophaga agilis]MDJ1502115.1 hypothetical protein [Xanthocytophaga agilis]
MLLSTTNLIIGRELWTFPEMRFVDKKSLAQASTLSCPVSFVEVKE